MSNLNQLKKNDLGALRLSDIERNIIVASTDLPSLSKSPKMEDEENLYTGLEQKNLRQREKMHYSETGRGYWVWGMRMVYRFWMVPNEDITLEIFKTND